MENCLFCKIVAGMIPSTKVYEDETVLAFRDIAPMAPTHVLVIPKTHIGSVAEIAPDNCELVAHTYHSKAVLLYSPYLISVTVGERRFVVR